MTRIRALQITIKLWHQKKWQKFPPERQQNLANEEPVKKDDNFYLKQLKRCFKPLTQKT